MIDVESLWTFESAVTNLHVLKDEFYKVMCNDDVLPLAAVIKLEKKRDFAFHCKCGKSHAGHGSIWAAISSTINHNTPAKDDPEFEEYVLHRKEFMTEVKHIDVRDYAEPFLKETDEWQYVEAALRHQQEVIAEFMNGLCSSKMTPETDTAHDVIIAYYCEKHETDHYVSPQKNNAFRAKINGANVPAEFSTQLSKLSQRIVLRDTSFVFCEWVEKNPQKKIGSIAAQRRREEKEARRVAEVERQASTTVKQQRNQDARARAKARIVKKKAKGEAKAKALRVPATEVASTPTPAFSFADSSLYILSPSLMSEEWLIEYHVCGRKVAYKKVSEALIYKHTNFQEGYDIYECPYCSHWHYGRKGKPVTPAVQAKRGLRWYKHNHNKANIFIHRIMMEEF